jgi:AraC-like DNA-binding protein
MDVGRHGCRREHPQSPLQRVGQPCPGRRGDPRDRCWPARRHARDRRCRCCPSGQHPCHWTGRSRRGRVGSKVPTRVRSLPASVVLRPDGHASVLADRRCRGAHGRVVTSANLHCGHISWVEVLGRYSNHADQGERIQDLMETAPSGRPEPETRTTKQVHRRLLPAQLDELMEDYKAGATLNEIAERLHVHRNNVSRALQGQGVSRRYRMIEGERLNEAIAEYQAGKSLAAVGAELGVSMDTVRAALKKAGVTLRPRPGWKY